MPPDPPPGLSSSPRRVTPVTGPGVTSSSQPGSNHLRPQLQLLRGHLEMLEPPQKLTRHTSSSSTTIFPQAGFYRGRTWQERLKGMKMPSPGQRQPRAGFVLGGVFLLQTHILISQAGINIVVSSRKKKTQQNFPLNNIKKTQMIALNTYEEGRKEDILVHKHRLLLFTKLAFLSYSLAELVTKSGFLA